MNASTHNSISPGCLISGPTLPERVEVLAIVPTGDSLKVIGRGLKSSLTYDPVLNHSQIAQLAPMVRDDDIEHIAAELAIAYEQARSWYGGKRRERESRFLDLISRRPHSEDPQTFVEVRFIEVTGRAGVGVAARSSNEHQTAVRRKGDYWLYVAVNCGGTPASNIIQDPARLGLEASDDRGTLPGQR